MTHTNQMTRGTGFDFVRVALIPNACGRPIFSKVKYFARPLFVATVVCTAVLQPTIRARLGHVLSQESSVRTPNERIGTPPLAAGYVCVSSVHALSTHLNVGSICRHTVAANGVFLSVADAPMKLRKQRPDALSDQPRFYNDLFVGLQLHAPLAPSQFGNFVHSLRPCRADLTKFCLPSASGSADHSGCVDLDVFSVCPTISLTNVHPRAHART